MRTSRRGKSRPTADDVFFTPQRKERPAPHAFVLDALERAAPTTRPMFGCLAVYVEEKIVLILRDKSAADPDNGVWIATTPEHHESLRAELPGMRSITVLGAGVTGWQVLPADAPDFEEATLHACELILAGDPRIGKIPGQRRVKRPASIAAAKKQSAAKKKTAKRSPKRG